VTVSSFLFSLFWSFYVLYMDTVANQTRIDIEVVVPEVPGVIAGMK
jgi:hypothetical protein